MATKTLADLLLGFGSFSQQLIIPRSQFKGTADTDGTVDALKDTELNVLADDYFNDDYWVYITDGGTGGGGAGDIRNIVDFTKVGGIVQPDISFSGIPKIGATYQIWKCHVQDVIDALNDALASIFPKLYKKLVWTDLGHSLLTADAALGQKNVVVADESLFFIGQGLTLKDDNASENCTIASITASTHTLTMADNLTNSYTVAATAKVYAKSGKYFNLGATIGNARLSGVFLQADSTSQRKPWTNCWVIYSSSGQRQLYFPIAVSVDDQTWVVEAMGRLEELTNPTDTVSVDDERVKLLYAETAYHFYFRQSNLVSAGDIRRLRALALSYRDQVNADYRRLWQPAPIERASIKTDED